MKEIKIIIPIVVNRCYGGFGLSVAASITLAERKNLTLRFEEGSNYPYIGDGWDRIEDIVPRNDPDLVEIVQEMGVRANGEGAKLVIVDAIVSIDIEDYDGKETPKVSGWFEQKL